MKKKYITLIPLLILNIFNQKILSNSLESTQESSKDYKQYKNKKKINNTWLLNSKFNFDNFLYALVSNIENDSDRVSNFEITSDTQTREGDLVIAEGNVVVEKNNLLLKTDSLIYDSKLKKLFLNGNINFKSEDNFIEATKVEYDLKKRKGFINNAYGVINFETLDLINLTKSEENHVNQYKNFDKSIRDVKVNAKTGLGIEDINLEKNNSEESFLKRLTSQKLKLDLNAMEKWRFRSDNIEIKDNEWFAKKLYLTNDPFNKPQLLIENTNFRLINNDDGITTKSKWSSIILDNGIKIPTGPRRVKIGKKNNLKWNIGYDSVEKDGLFITRNLDQIYFSEEKKTTLDIQKEFYIQRGVLVKTNSFSNKRDSLLSEKVNQDAKFLDYFGLNSELNSKINNFDLKVNFNLNSFDSEKLKKISTFKSELSKIIFEENKKDSQTKTILSFFGNYRDKVWNGSLGEKEIISAYGTKIEKNNNWKKNKVYKSSTIATSYGEFQSNKKDSPLERISKNRFNLLLERNHTYPIWRKNKQNFIDDEFIFSPSVIENGLTFYTQAKIDLYRYDDKSFQNLFTFRAGPELTLGNFKNNILDYTQISTFAKATIAKGESPFDFDQAVDNHKIEINLKQQLFGPLSLNYSTDYNLDINSENYKEFFNNRIELLWNKRAYNLGFYYNSDNQRGGIKFNIYSFDFKGSGKNFK